MADHDHDPDFELLCDLARDEIAEMTIDDVKALIDGGAKVTLLDVREDREWVADRIVGARHLSRGILERDIRKHVASKEEEMVLYCGGGYRSALAAHNLQKMGYSRVASMAGGIRAWREAGYPVDADPVQEAFDD